MGDLYARTNTQVIQNVAIDGADHVVATGYFAGTIAFGGPDLVRGYGVAIDPQDNILLTGGFYGSIEIAGKDLLSNEGDSTSDVFVAKLKP